MSIKLFSVLLLVSAQSCLFKRPAPPAPDMTAVKEHLLETDRAFSDLSEKKGMKAAFIEYIDSNGVLLRADEFPIVGADAIDYLIRQDDKDYSLTWAPKDGEVAQSGDMGFTYGVFTLKYKNMDSVQRGTYVSIWRRQSDGTWKVSLDSGNGGVGELP